MQENKTEHKRYYHIIILVMLVFFVISFITNILNSIIVDVKNSFDLSLTLRVYCLLRFLSRMALCPSPPVFSRKNIASAACSLFRSW